MGRRPRISRSTEREKSASTADVRNRVPAQQRAKAKLRYVLPEKLHFFPSKKAHFSVRTKTHFYSPEENGRRSKERIWIIKYI